MSWRLQVILLLLIGIRYGYPAGNTAYRWYYPLLDSLAHFESPVMDIVFTIDWIAIPMLGGCGMICK